MEKGYIHSLVTGLVAVFIVAIFVVFGKGPSSLGTDVTYNSGTGSYTDGSDLRQNVQAMAERMSGVSQYQILQADSQGRMQAVAPSALAGTAWDFDGLSATGFVEKGSATITASSTITAAQVCDSASFNLVPASTTPTHTLPAADSLFSDCLTANGDTRTITLFNATATGTRWIAGTSSTLIWSNTSSTLAKLEGGASARITFVRTSTDGGYQALITAIANR